MSARRSSDNVGHSVRDAIAKLTPAQKGSLGESFFLEVLSPGAKRISHLGVRADVQLPTGERVDLKLHRNVPVNRSKVVWYWIDYLSKKADETGQTTIWRVMPGRPREPAKIDFENRTFEAYFAKWQENRPRSRRGARSKATGGQREVAIAKAKAKLRGLLPQFSDPRFLVRQAGASGRLTVAPAIYSHNAIQRAPTGATIVLIGDDDWKGVQEYWVFEHATPLASIKPLLESVGEERPDIRWRFRQDAFPKLWRHKL